MLGDDVRNDAERQPVGDDDTPIGDVRDLFGGTLQAQDIHVPACGPQTANDLPIVGIAAGEGVEIARHQKGDGHRAQARSSAGSAPS